MFNAVAILIPLLGFAKIGFATVSIGTSSKVYSIDHQIEILVSGLENGDEYTVHAETIDESGRVWTSHATFVAKNSSINFLDIPIRGTYSVSSKHGLFWSMQPLNYQKDRDFFRPAEPFVTHLKLSDFSKRVLAQTSFERKIQSDLLRIEESRTAESYFDLVIPNMPGKKPAILLLGGSEGGLNNGDAKVISSHGFAVMALAYFGVGTLPSELSQIPLEYIEKNARILRSHPEVDPSRINIWGTSKGGELALLSAATFPELFKAVVAVVPSNLIWQGLTSDLKLNSSWSHKGKDLAFLPFIFEESDFLSRPFRLRVGYDRAIGSIKNLQFAEIPIEKISGPILFVSGTDDQVWPSSTMAELALKRLNQRKFNHEVVHIKNEGAGHFIGLPAWPTTGRIFGPNFAGGNQEADGLACERSWPRIIRFLRDLGGEETRP